MKLNTKKNPNNPKKKWAKDLNTHFSKKDIQMANRDIKKMLNITNYQRNANITTMRYHLAPVRIAIINKSTNKC